MYTALARRLCAMHRFSKSRIIILAAVILAVLYVFAAGFGKHTLSWTKPTPPATPRLDRLPPLILWAWERPENLDFVDSSKVAVAFLSKTIFLRADRVVVRPRLQPLTLADKATVIAVARIESEANERPQLSATQISEAAREIAELSRLPRVVGVQVDFDAKVSERDFYRQLLIDLRKQLPDSTALTITALASWCQGDNWLEGLPIDEAVPMLFRMGVDRRQILSQLTSERPFKSKKCQSSIGVSLDEPIDGLPAARRVYVFNPNSWSPESVATQLRNNKK